jgi:aldehyde:ferredoxin oxidoreductase
MLNGYAGKVLWVDLTKGILKEEKLEEKLYRDYVGGYGLGAKILFDHQKPQVDPLGPENILGFVTSPLTGTQALVGSRYTVVGKSPLTGTWGDANSGGSFGPYLKFSGYDAVFFTGKSPQPVYLLIDNGKAELMGASQLWGKDTFETEDILKAELGKEVEIACIGPAGERLSLIAAVMNNKGRCAARSGLGAVMGAKRLKAIAVTGTQKILVFDEAKVAELRKKYTPLLGGPIGAFRAFGTPVLTIGNYEVGDSPIKNWTGAPKVDFPTIEKIGANAVIERETKKYACWHCVIGCGGHMKEGTGEYQYAAGAHKPEYETISMFGSNLLNDNLESIIKVNDICNRAGLDTISTGASIALVIEAYEQGLLTKKDTEGLEMTWGNHHSIVAMTEKIAKLEGLGKILADGAAQAAARIGKGTEVMAIHIGGQELAAHDSRFDVGFAYGYRMDATPGRHTQGGGLIPAGLPLPEHDPKSIKGQGAAFKMKSDYNHFTASAGVCKFVNLTLPDVNVIVEFMNAVTGWNLTLQESLKIGERIANIRQAFNAREGINQTLFKTADREAGRPPMKVGPHAGVTIDEGAIIQEYFGAMDWDIQTAKPSPKKLEELGMPEIVRALYK